MLIDDLTEATTELELKRRKLLAAIGSGALATATAGTLITAVRYLSPAVLYEAASRFEAGLLESIPVGGLVTFPERKVYVGRTESGLYALSSICTHLGCMTRYEPEQKRLFCPCHGSQFSLSGEVVAGPAPRPLSRLQVIVANDAVVVDTQKQVAPGEETKV